MLIRFVVERKVNGDWRVVARGVEAKGAEAAQVAVARAADDAGVYRVRPLGGADGSAAVFSVPAYGLPVPIEK